ncbi:MAG: Cartilage oligomeric matrix protein, partial [Parcubacteria group bacterium GW2011_GWA2_38_13]
NCPPSKCTTPLMCANPDQANADLAGGDTLGDICDPCDHSLQNDQDHDGVCENGADNLSNLPDNCPSIFNPDQRDSDSNGSGDACDIICQKDSDKDGVCDEIDNCPNVLNPSQANSDGGGCCPPATPRFCTSDTDFPGYVCGAGGGDDIMCFTINDDPDDLGNNIHNEHCKTPDQMAGQIWPNGKEFGDACDPNTDTDADGFATGFCGAYSTGDYTGYSAVDFRICHTDSDCTTFTLPAGVSTGIESTKCSIMPASKAAGVKLDNCTTPDFYSANPGQEDFDKDLVGYFCDTCIDSDKDEFTNTIINEGFENGASNWKVLLSNGANIPLDISNNFRHIDDTAWEGRTTADTSYRGIHAAHLYLEKNGLKKIINKISLGGPVRVPSGIVNDRVYYTLRAYVRSSVLGNQISMKAMRGCTNDVASAKPGIPYSAGCKGGYNVFGEAVNVSDEWTQIEIDFYIDYFGAQNEVALIFEADTKGDYYIDDIQLFYKANIGGTSADSCGEKKPDNCMSFNNPSQPDSDEDNEGDDCDLCSDKDGDGWGDPGQTIKNCSKSFDTADNCPITQNPKQEDTDNDAKLCNFTVAMPYKTKTTNVSCRGDATNFVPKDCDFCGGDACDLDADGDKCYNWAQTKNYSYNWQLDLPGPLDVAGNLINREEDYLRSNFHYEASWLKSSTDMDRDNFPDDCDKQVCGDAQVSLGAPGVCSDGTVGLNQCEECDKNRFAPTTICDTKNPIPSSSGTYRDIYPFNTTDINLRFVAHFDGNEQATGRAKTFIPTDSNIDPADYVQGAYNLATMDDGVTLSPTSILRYEPSAYNLTQGTIQMWVKPLRNINPINIRDTLGNIVKSYPITWNQNDWHMLTISYVLKYENPVSREKIYSYTFYFDAVKQAESAEMPGLSGNLDIPAWLAMFGIQPVDMVLDEFATFSNPINDESVIRAFYDAIYNQCADSTVSDVTKYMVDNLCAVCNTLQCQINVLRMCNPVEIGVIRVPKVSATNYLWVANNNINTVTQMAALPINSYNSGDRIHEYRICKVGGAITCVDPGGCPSGYCAFDHAPTDKNSSCNQDCAGDAKDPTRVATNVEDDTAWVAYRAISSLSASAYSGVGYFDANKGLIKYCPIPNQLMRGMVIDKDGNGWAGSTNENIYKFDKSASGCPNPNVPVISGIAVYGMAIDSKDNVWISANDGDDNTYMIENISEIVIPAAPVALSTVNCMGATVNGIRCHWYNTDFIYGIAVDSLDRAWVGRHEGLSKELYVINANETGEVPMKTIAPGGIRIGVALQDIGTALNVRMLATEDDSFDHFYLYDYNNSTGDVTYFGPSTDLSGYQDVMIATGDSAGNIWAVSQSGGNVLKLDFSGQIIGGIFTTSWNVANSGHYMYSDFTGINRAMVFRTGVATYPPVGGFSSFDSSLTSWSGRWGKVLYDRENMTPDMTDVRVYVYLTDNLADLSSISSDSWILADPYDSSRDQYNKCVNQACEKKGKYMKIQVKLSTKNKDQTKDPRISNLRITCKDNNGKNIY